MKSDDLRPGRYNSFNGSDQSNKSLIKTDLFAKLAPIYPYQLSDNVVAEKVLNALQWNTFIPYGKLNVIVKNGIVYLTGELEWPCQQELAMTLISDVKGVHGIVDHTIISGKKVEHSIKDEITCALKIRVPLEVGKIGIETAGSTVILTGRVKSWDKRKEIAQVAWSAPGVTAVEDNIEIDE